jgi:predicted dehydrogenase
MNLLIIGCGSIGRRHAMNAIHLGADVALCDLDTKHMREFGEKVGIINYYTDYQTAIEENDFDAAVICTPSFFHFKPGKALVEHGIPILMEKPLCLSLDEAYQLERIVRKRDSIFMMAHTYRFRDEWIAVKRLLDEWPLGQIFSAEFTGGWYLPDWHIKEDYRAGYAGRKELGGGVMFTSMSHIFDIVRWFFGDIDMTTGISMKQSNLDINVDDAVVCILKTFSGVTITIIEDFISCLPRRQLRINAENGYIEIDFNRKKMFFWDSHVKRYDPTVEAEASTNPDLFRILKDGVGYDLEPIVTILECSGNDAYINELKSFFKITSEGRTRFALDIDSGIKVLEIIHHTGIQHW